MSRHLIDGLNPRHLVYVGWDPPLSTYFGQVYDPARGEDENPIYWIGTDRPAQFPEVAELVKAMEKHFGANHRPISTGVVVEGLAFGMLFEVEVKAYVGEK